MQYRSFLCLIPMFFFTGCISDSVALPNLLHPGHISAQQDRMKRFDPFGRTDIGPKIPGDRPSGSTEKTPLPQHLKEYEYNGYQQR